MRNKLAILILLPIIIPLWLIGWSLLYIGSSKPKKNQEQPEENTIEFLTPIPEEIPA